MTRSVLWVAALALGACGGNQVKRDQQFFACKDRIASYVANRHLGGDEVGVQIDCAEAGPRIKRWRVAKDGKRDEEVRPITPGEFDKAWRGIDGVGWQYLKNCTNGSLDKHDPTYTFDVRDDEAKNSFECQTREVPYPYHDITDSLDMLASQGRRQLGDDEPADAKALDKKDQRH